MKKKEILSFMKSLLYDRHISKQSRFFIREVLIPFITDRQGIKYFKTIIEVVKEEIMNKSIFIFGKNYTKQYLSYSANLDKLDKLNLKDNNIQEIIKQLVNWYINITTAYILKYKLIYIPKLTMLEPPTERGDRVVVVYNKKFLEKRRKVIERQQKIEKEIKRLKGISRKDRLKLVNYILNPVLIDKNDLVDLSISQLGKYFEEMVYLSKCIAYDYSINLNGQKFDVSDILRLKKDRVFLYQSVSNILEYYITKIFELGAKDIISFVKEIKRIYNIFKTKLKKSNDREKNFWLNLVHSDKTKQGMGLLMVSVHLVSKFNLLSRRFYNKMLKVIYEQSYDKEYEIEDIVMMFKLLSSKDYECYKMPRPVHFQSEVLYYYFYDDVIYYDWLLLTIHQSILKHLQKIDKSLRPPAKEIEDYLKKVLKYVTPTISKVKKIREIFGSIVDTLFINGIYKKIEVDFSFLSKYVKGE